MKYTALSALAALCLILPTSEVQAYELLDLPPGAYVESSPTTTIVKFKDGSYMENTPTRVKIFGDEAMQFHFKNSPTLKNLKHIYKAEDFKSFETKPTGWIMNFVDGSYLEQTPTSLKVSPGLGSEYQGKFVKLHYEGAQNSNNNTQSSSQSSSYSSSQEDKTHSNHSHDSSHQSLDLVNTEIRSQNYANRNLSGSRLSNIKFYDSDFSGVDFSNTTFRNVSFYTSNLTNVNFAGADFVNVSFHDGDARGSSFDGALISNVSFNRTKLKDVDFTRAGRTRNLNVRNADFSGSGVTTTIAQGRIAGRIQSDQIARQLQDTNAKSQYHDGPTIDLAINFEFDSDNLTKEGWEQVTELGNALNTGDLKSANFLIEGHTDSMGSDDYNADLSLRRAATIRKALNEKFTIDSSRLTIKGYGEERPLESNNTDAGRAKNRRVTVVNLSQ